MIISLFSSFSAHWRLGGLVEISTKNDESSGRAPTRTIGDLSSGGESTLSRISLTPASSPEPITPSERPVVSLEDALSSKIKPIRLDLPKPHDFAMDDDAERNAGVVSTPHPPTRADASPSMILSGSTTSSIQYENGMRVLVVDDDPLTRKLMSRMLTRLGCKVTTAENGEIALDLMLNPTVRPTPSSENTGSTGLVPGDASTVGDERYAVVFLDNQMPVMSGLEAVAKLRRQGRKDFVVGVTGNSLFM